MKSQYMKIINLFCKTCDYQSIQKGNLRTHEESVLGGSKFAFKMSDECGKTFFCKACDNEFRYIVSLKTHEKSVHEDYKFVLCDM